MVIVLMETDIVRMRIQLVIIRVDVIVSARVLAGSNSLLIYYRVHRAAVVSRGRICKHEPFLAQFTFGEDKY